MSSGIVLQHSEIFSLLPITWTTLSTIFTAALAWIAFHQIRKDRPIFRAKPFHIFKRKQNRKITSVWWNIDVYNDGARQLWITRVFIKEKGKDAAPKEGWQDTRIAPGDKTTIQHMTNGKQAFESIEAFHLRDGQGKTHTIRADDFPLEFDIEDFGV